ncbi:MAG TPA: hypothetical protein VFU93_14395 [Acidimicrobiales bacterium]|nr:hypothetical protein [Acidimicrobiales bacterium]
MRRIAVLAVLVFTACGGDGDSALAPASTTPSTTAPPSTSTSLTSTTAAALEPLDLAISIHAEGFDDRNPAVYPRHLEALELVASEAERAGVTLTFELSLPFAEGARAADDGWVAGLPARGHSVGVHADLGFPALPPGRFERRLADHKALVEDLLGASVSHVSGVCSEAPWVEPVAGAGFEAATGMVEFCLKSLDEPPPEAVACRTPADCHDWVPSDLARALHPWRTGTSADWLTPDPAGDLWLIPSREMPTEPDELSAIVAEHLAAREPGRTNSLVFAWSIGSPPRPGLMTELAAAVVDVADSVRWVAVPELAR